MNNKQIIIVVLAVIILILLITLIILYNKETECPPLICDPCPECLLDSLHRLSIVLNNTRIPMYLFNYYGDVSFTSEDRLYDNIKFIYHNDRLTTIETDEGIPLIFEINKNGEKRFKFSNDIENPILAEIELIGDNGVKIFAEVDNKKYYLSESDFDISKLSCPYILPSKATRYPRVLSIL